MTEQAQIHPLGVALALAFALSIGSLLWWMLHPPAPKRAPIPVPAAPGIPRILVGFHGSPFGEKLLRLACELAREESAPVTALYVVEVPMTLPLGASVPEEDLRAEQVLQRAREIGASAGVGVDTETRRARSAGRAIVEAARSHPTRLVVIGLLERRGRSERLFGASAEFVLRHAPCEVLLGRPGEQEL